jgi:hypothetical protein
VTNPIFESARSFSRKRRNWTADEFVQLFAMDIDSLLTMLWISSYDRLGKLHGAVMPALFE